MYVRRLAPNTLVPLLLLLAATGLGPKAEAQWREGIASWADTTLGLRTTKWAGPRTAFPTPRERPLSAQRIDSLLSPISVHGAAGVPPERLAAVLAAAEATHELGRAAGVLDSFGDAGQGGTPGRDIYVLDQPEVGATAFADASGNFAALDGARAYSVVDARLPSESLPVCTAQALFDAQLLELDPAEAASVRASSAAYFAWLVTGEPGCDETPRPDGWYADSPFADPASGGAWLRELAAQRDQNRGTFLHAMWHFARQRTWEGTDLRASPDLFEAIAKALELERVQLNDVVAEIASVRARTGYSRVRGIPIMGLPAFLRSLELEPLASLAVVVRLDQPRPGTRLRAWSKGELGPRYLLAATRLGPEDEPLTRVVAAPRREPSSQLSIELDAATHAVLITVTHMGEGVPDLDPPLARHTVGLTVDSVR